MLRSFLHFSFGHIKGIVSRDWGDLLMVSVDRQKVPDIPATYLFLILMLSSYVKFNICVLCRHRFYVSLLLGEGCSGEENAPVGVYFALRGGML
jgi:hypothetical protein